jgi:hypothetical protein
MFRSARVGVVFAVIALALPAAGSGSEPGASAAGSCRLSTSEQRNLGATYVLQLTVRKTTCSKGKSLVKAFHACRRSRGGKKGFCPRVNGYSCKESRFNKTKTQYDSRATCTRGSKSVKHTYTQFT